MSVSDALGVLDSCYKAYQRFDKDRHIYKQNQGSFDLISTYKEYITPWLGVEEQLPSEAKLELKNMQIPLRALNDLMTNPPGPLRLQANWNQRWGENFVRLRESYEKFSQSLDRSPSAAVTLMQLSPTTGAFWIKERCKEEMSLEEFERKIKNRYHEDLETDAKTFLDFPLADLKIVMKQIAAEESSVVTVDSLKSWLIVQQQKEVKRNPRSTLQRTGTTPVKVNDLRQHLLHALEDVKKEKETPVKPPTPAPVQVTVDVTPPRATTHTGIVSPSSPTNPPTFTASMSVPGTPGPHGAGHGRGLSFSETNSEDFSVRLTKLSPLPSEVRGGDKCILGDTETGILYKAKYMGNDVVVKCFDQKLNDETREDIKVECAIMRKLHHANVGRLFGANLTDKDTCMLLEFAHCGSLYHALHRAKTKLDWPTRLSIATDIARGINCLHSQDPPILHRNLTSSAILLRSGYQAFIGDFGLSKVKTNPQSKITPGQGSHQWMPPEAFDDEGKSTLAIDIYSFAIILWEILTYEVPFPAWKEIRLARHLERGGRLDVPSLEERKKLGIPDGYIQLMEACWAQKWEDRPKAEDVLNILTSLQAVKPETKEEKYVKDLLARVDCSQYTQAFFSAGYDSEKHIKSLTREDLLGLNVKPAHAKVILDAIKPKGILATLLGWFR